MYSQKIKNQRMEIVNNHIAKGIIQIFENEKLLVEIELKNPAGNIENGILSLSGLPLQGIAISGGKADRANIIEKDLKTIAIEGLSVGVKDKNINIDNDNIEVNQIIQLKSGVMVHG
jgi:hypothetical protein